VTLKDRWRAARPAVLSGVAFQFLCLVGRTLRFHARDLEGRNGPLILCGWHGTTFGFAYHFRNRGAWVIISHSKDGDIQASIFRRLGYQIIRGSTGRGGIRAAVEGIRSLKEGGIMALTPDGPRGPSGVVQSGVMLMAQKSGAKILPIGTGYSRKLVVNTWDRYCVPWIFSRVHVVAGPELSVPADASEEELERLRVELEQAIHRTQAAADRLAREESS
jgi:lysophospholipid acyltransferase (LPLAT)-like uncharacterized protein